MIQDFQYFGIDYFEISSNKCESIFIKIFVKNAYVHVFN